MLGMETLMLEGQRQPFPHLSFVKPVQIETPSRRQLKLKPREMYCKRTKCNLSVVECQKYNLPPKRPVDFEKRKKEDLSKDGVGKNV